jgi:hypothetical protein
MSKFMKTCISFWVIYFVYACAVLAIVFDLYVWRLYG